MGVDPLPPFFKIPPLLSASPLLLSLGCAPVEPPRLDAPACDAKAEFGSKEGDLAQNFVLKDQQGDDTYLSDFCGRVVVLQMGAMWCRSCQLEASRIPALMDDFGERGVVVVSLMAETVEGKPPQPRDLEAWDVTFDLNTPVLGDRSWKVWDRYFAREITPGALLLDREGRIVSKDLVVTREQIEELL